LIRGADVINNWEAKIGLSRLIGKGNIGISHPARIRQRLFAFFPQTKFFVFYKRLLFAA